MGRKRRTKSVLIAEVLAEGRAARTEEIRYVSFRGISFWHRAVRTLVLAPSILTPVCESMA